MTLETGTQLGDWTVEGAASGDAWLARQSHAAWRKVELRPLGAADPSDAAARVDALTSLDHPNLEPLVQLVEHRGSWFVVTERRRGVALSEAWPAECPSRRQALTEALAVAQGLWYAHQHGIAHGALDPGRVWLGEDGRIRIVGWFVEPHPTVSADRRAVAELLQWLFRDVRPELAGVTDWVHATLADPVSTSIGELRTSLARLHGELLGATTPHVTPSEAQTTFYDDEDGPSGPRTPHQIGRYVILREIGRGGAGVVYEAVDPDLQRHVALKVLLAGDFARARDQQRFLNEARAVAQLDHPNIVHVLEFDRHDGRAWYAMDLVDGPNLLQVIRDRGRLPWRTAVRLAASLARALQHAHNQGLVHRDVKPNNVLVESDLEPRLTDFGLALFTDEGTQARLTRTGQVLGTPSYMSPEQANGDLHRIGPATDVYGVGVVLYEALTGQVPFEGERPLSIIAAVVEGRVRAPRQLVGGIPRQVEHTCLKAMQVDPGDRYATAADLAEDLERCLRGEPILATPPTFADQLRWFVRRNRAQLGVLATAIGVALLILATSTAVVGARSVRRTTIAEAEAETALTSVMARIEELEAEGRPAQAEESWQAFARRPEHRGTRALVEGWWWRADHLAAQDDERGQIAALGMAYAAAERRRDQERSLLRLADQARAQGSLGRLPRIVATLDSRAPRLASTREIRGLRRDALSSERRLAEAAEVEGGPEAAVLSALAGATRTRRSATRAVPWTGADGALLLWSSATAPVLVRAAPTLSVVRTLDGVQWTDDQLVVPTERQATFWVGEGGAATLLALRDGRPIPLRTYDGTLHAATLGPDRSGRGVVPILALDDRLVEPTSSGTALRDVHAPTSGAGSVIRDVVSADLDGDGRTEVIAAAAEWDAFDVRVFERGGNTTRLVARRKLGAVSDLAVLPHPDGTASLIATKVDRAPRPELFGADRPFGESRGLWRLRRSEDRLTGTRIAALPCTGLQTGDLDGDGDADVAGQCGEDLWIWVQDGDDLLPLPIRSLTLLELANLDADAALEVVVSDPADGDRVWVLGAGDEALPPIRPESWVEAPPPREATPAFRESWQRAEELAFIGQLEQGADAMEQLAELHWGEPLGWAATLRAATIHDVGGRPVHAGRLALRAAEALDGLERVAALHAAARAWQNAREPRRELEALEQLRDLGALDRADVVRLRRLEDRAARPTLDLDLREPLGPDWHIDQPLSLLHEPGSGLGVEAFGNQTLAHVPVQWDGGALELDVAFLVRGVEWDAGLQVGVVPAGTEAPFYGIEVVGEAGPEGVQPIIRCRAGSVTREHELGLGEPRTARLQLFEDERGFGCGFAGEDGFRAESLAPVPVMGFGRWDLVVRATGASDTVLDATLHAVAMRGAARDVEADDGDEARRAFANGRTYDALAALDAGDADPLLRVAIAAARSDGQTLRALLERPGELAVDAVLAHLLHCRYGSLAPDLQRVLGDDYPWWFARAWDTALSRPMPDGALAEAVLTSLDRLEDARLTSAEDRVAWIRLGAKRAAAALGVGDLPLAERSIDATLGWFEQLRTEDRAGRDVTRLRTTVARLHLDRAALALRREQPLAVALDAVRHGLLWAPDPLSLLDRALARADLAALAATPLLQQWHLALRTGRAIDFGTPDGG